MAEHRGDKRSSRVAKIAILARRQMACRLHNIRVARKEETGVTTFAGYVRVGAVEVEACAEVIKRLLREQHAPHQD